MKRIRVRIHPATENTELKVEVLKGIQPATSTSGVCASSSSNSDTPGGPRGPSRVQFVTDGQFVEQSPAERYADRKLLLVTQNLKDQLDAETAREFERKERDKKEDEKAKTEAAVAEGGERQGGSAKKGSEQARRLRRKEARHADGAHGSRSGRSSAEPRRAVQSQAGVAASNPHGVAMPHNMRRLRIAARQEK